MIVNICCTESSGSTFFSKILDRHPKIACGNELKLFSILMLYDNYPDFVEGAPIIKKFGVTSNPYRSKSLTLKNFASYGLSSEKAWRWVHDSRNIQELAEKFKNHIAETTNKPIWAEKTPSNIRLAAKFAHAFPHAKVIHLVRDPRDVVLSLMSRGYSIYEAADHWLASIAAIQAIRSSNNVLEISYEELIRRREQTLEKVCSFLNIDFDIKYFMEDTYRSKSLSQFIGFYSWNIDPEEGFSPRSIGKFRNSPYDLSPISTLQLSQNYANLLGVERFGLRELAEDYGYIISHNGGDACSHIPIYGREYTDMLNKMKQWEGIERKLEAVPHSDKIALYGAGEHSERLLEFILGNTDLDIAFVTDGNSSLWGGELEGLEIFPPEKIIQDNIDTVIVSSFAHQSQMERYLREELAFRGKIVSIYDTERDFFPFYMNVPHTYERQEYMVKSLY
ncbi:MAG: sulfotransferase [Spirochaetia bacterium]